MGQGLFGAALAAVALLAATWLLPADLESITIDAALDHEGATVRLAGVVVDTWRYDGGDRGFVVADAGTGLPVRGPDVEVHRGQWVTMVGRLDRWSGELMLHATAVAVDLENAPAARQPSWSDVADRPDDWRLGAVRLSGWYDERFGDGEWISIATGDGPWGRVREGAVSATGSIGYDDQCMCYRFHAGAIEPAGVVDA